MGNQVGGSPYVLDTVGVIWEKKPHRVKCIQWIDVAGDITDADDMDFTIDGQAVTIAIQRPTDAGFAPGAVFYEVSPDTVVNKFELVTLDGGNILVWFD